MYNYWTKKIKDNTKVKIIFGVKEKISFYKQNKKIKKVIIIILLLNLFVNNTNISFDENKKPIEVFEDKNFNSNNWIVLTAFNPPSSFIINLIEKLEKWKIVVIGNNETNDNKWNIFKSSNKLVYLSNDAQKNLNYSILKYLKHNSYFRKSLGYLYCIEHGAKEIYEIDEDLVFNNKSFLNYYSNNIHISYVKREDSLMSNPYLHFGNKNIWPRGFRINDIGKQTEIKFHFSSSSNIPLKPLIFQGLINIFPDIDSIFYLTRIKKQNIFTFQCSNSYPLLYFPNNYIPINSKNTRYLYNIFPLLMFPISLDENIADIWRGYIIQYFAWKMEGVVIYYNSNFNRTFIHKQKFNFIKEKKNYFELNKLVELLNSFSDANYNKDSIEIYNNFLKLLYDYKLIEKLDIKIYKAFINDLINIGYNFSFFSFSETKTKNNALNYEINANFDLYIPSSLFITKNYNFKLMNHFSPNKVYEDILLIINYNRKGFLALNKYLKTLYNKYFPNIIFIYPNNSPENNITSCNESERGYYSYICFKKIYLKYPNYKGYLYINDDLFLKVWEITNFNFSIPWINQFYPLNKKWDHYSECYPLYNIIEKNEEWKNNIIKFNGYFEVVFGMSDFYYLPNYYASKIIYIFDKMYKSKIFLECAIPNSMGILLSSKYQIIFIRALWGNQRKKAINYLYSQYNQITIHPIKLSNETSREKVFQYIYFINSNGY